MKENAGSVLQTCSRTCAAGTSTSAPHARSTRPVATGTTAISGMQDVAHETNDADQTALAVELRLALGAQAGEARLRDVATKGGFTRFRRATATPFNLVLEARP